MREPGATGAEPQRGAGRRSSFGLMALPVWILLWFARGVRDELLVPALGVLALVVLALAARRRLHREPQTLAVFALMLIVLVLVHPGEPFAELRLAREAEALAAQAFARAEQDPSRAAFHAESAAGFLETATSTRWGAAYGVASAFLLALFATGCAREVWQSLGGRARGAAA